MFVIIFRKVGIKMSQKIRQDISLGSNIRKIRKKLNFTQSQVVAKLQLRGFNISRSIYSQIELGTYNIKVSELVAIKAILNCSFDDLFENLS